MPRNTRRLLLAIVAIAAASPASLFAASGGGDAQVPSALWIAPFCVLLLAIAVLPLVPHLSHWWEKNQSKLIVSVALSLATCAYYAMRGYGVHDSDAGLPAVGSVLTHSLIHDFFPFIVLLFSLFTISGGINLSGDIPAHPVTNATFLFVGALLASFVGTTGASMLMIRPLLQVNRERKHVAHTVIFFIFLVSNIGGSLLPVGDPPLFLGFLNGVPFLWTLHLMPEWITCVLLLLGVYWAFDMVMYGREEKKDIRLDESIRIPLRLTGSINFLFLAGVVVAVALLVPGKKLPGTDWEIPHLFIREWIQLGLAGLSLALTPKSVREANNFNFGAIIEVACLFVGIFITMQVPIEILNLEGAKLGLTAPIHFFWASGLLSSVLDNAPTYVVFFQTAGSLPHAAGDVLLNGVNTSSGAISVPLLKAISCGSVFMGANTYIGNGPNFMVKSIAEQMGVKMPGFFGYMVYSGLILIPLFIVISFLFFV